MNINWKKGLFRTWVVITTFWVLAAGGYAYVYPGYATTERLYEVEEEARENQAGIWKLPEKERVKPWEWRKQKKAASSG